MKLASALFLFAFAAHGAIPRVVYVMQSQNSIIPIKDTVLARADGIVVRTKWADVEPTKGVFRWDYLKKELARAARMKKKVQLEILSGDDSPRWLVAAGAKVYKFSGGQVPLPWDAVFQERYAVMIGAAVKALDLTPVTHFHSIGADSAEWHYQSNFGSGFYTQPAYSDERMVDGHVDAAATLVNLFPAKVRIVCDIGDHGKAWTGMAISWLKRSFPNRIGFQMNSMSAKTSLTYAGYTRIKDAAAEGFSSGFEMVGPSTDTARFGGPFSAVIPKMDQTWASWEIRYQADVQ